MEYINLKNDIAEKLRSLSNSITIEDRSQALIDLNISRPTLDKYLSGRVIKLDTALRMLQYFTKKINKRVLLVSKQVVA